MTSNRKSLLAVLPVAPWPVRDSGISVRFHPILMSLARDCDIDVVVLADYRETLPHDPLLDVVRSARVCYFNRAKAPSVPRRLQTWAEILSPAGAPYRYASYHTAAVVEVLRELTSQHTYDTLLWVCPEHRAALDTLRPELGSARIVYDCVDSPLLHYKREMARNGVPSLLRRADLWKTKRWERRLTRNVDASVYISPIDAAAAMDGEPSTSTVIPNGVFVDDVPPVGLQEATEPYLGFLGHMGYPPNIDAALRLHDEIFRPLKSEMPALKLMIIGRAPDPRVQRLTASDVVVTGTVDNIWEHIARVKIFSFPLASGAGLQNKLLEAMYAGKPVVTTEICRRSLGARGGRDLLASESTTGLRDHVRALLTDDQLARSLSEAGQRFVRERFQISKVIADYQQLLFPT
jgi:glycosyltransferase involved in cell wall biosynthesis